MKIVRYQSNGHIGQAADLGSGEYARIAGDLFKGFQVTDELVTVDRLLAPLAPVAIWCIGQNYRRHAAEIGADPPEIPIVFAKGINSVQDPDGPILLPATARSDEVDYECELVVVIGKPCRNVTPETALDYVFGYTCGNDVSARDWQLRLGGSQWCRGKSFDTFAPIGPCVVTGDSIPNPNGLRIQTLLNHETVQDWTTSDMIFDVPTLVSFLSQSTTLLPGTLIFTGTPHGVGMSRNPPRWLRDGDVVSVAIEGIGTLTNPVRSEA